MSTPLLIAVVSCILKERERETGCDRLATEVSNAGHMHEGAADSLLTRCFDQESRVND